jgi:2-(3-amino-3-carboxypropyl)histidine synthase
MHGEIKIMFDRKRNSDILSLLEQKNAKKILIQVPEGLKMNVQDLADFLGKNGIEPLISIEPCFGACDLRDSEAKKLGCDLLLHIGHADLGIKTEVPVVYYEYFIDYDFIPMLRAVIRQIKFRKICLVTTVQFGEGMKTAKKFLEKNGFVVYDGGYVLGCDVSGARQYERMAECYMFMGSGRFHPLGLQERTERPVLFLDVEKRTLEDLSEEKDKMKIKRKLRIEKAKYLQNFGIMVSTTPGQTRMKQAGEIKRKLEKAGKLAYVLAGDHFTPEKLLGLKIDVLINTACPRMRDDAEQFGKIILNADDVDEMLAENKG